MKSKKEAAKPVSQKEQPKPEQLAKEAPSAKKVTKPVEQEAAGSVGGSPLLERFLQKNMTDRMREVDEKVIAEAIKTLLFEEGEKNKRLN